MPHHLFSSLRSQLILLVLIATIPAMGLTVYTGLHQRQRAAAAAHEDALRLARVASTEQIQLLESARVLLVALARLPEVRRQDPKRCNRLFADLGKQYPRFVNLGMIAPTGEVICSATPGPSTVNLGGRGDFYRAVSTREFAIGDYQIASTTGKASINVAYPIISTSGWIDMVLFISMDLDWFTQLAAKAGLPEGATLTVIDLRGTVLARYPDPEQWVGRLVPEAPILHVIRSTPGEGTTIVSGLDGIRRLYAFAALGDPTEPGQAYVYVGIPSGIAFAEVNRLLVRNIVGLTVIALLALVAAWVFGDLFLLRKVRALVTAAGRLRAGDLGARTGLRHTNGELSLLSRGFDEMAAGLQARAGEAEAAQESLRRYAERLKILHGIDQAILAAQSPEDIADAALRSIWKLIPYRRATVGVYDFTAGEFRVLATHALGSNPISPGTRLPLESLGDIDRTLDDLRQGRVHRLELRSLSAPSPVIQAVLAEGILELTVIPLIVQGELIGSFSFGEERSLILTPEHIEIAREVADQLAVAIQQTRLREGLRRHAADLEHRVAERTQQLSASEEAFRAVAETALDAIVSADSRGNIIYMNAAAQKLFGLTSQEAIGEPITILMPARYHEDHRRGLQRFLATGEAHVIGKVVELAGKRKDGSEFPLELSLANWKAGKEIFFTAILRDISARKEAEHAIQQAKQEAERASLAKSEFLSRMSHELRTPLNAVLGFAQLLEMDTLSAEQRESVEHIRKGGSHLLGLINEVLDIARIEAGRLAVSLEPVSVELIVQESLDLIAPLAAAEGIQLNGNLAETRERHVLADRQRLKQVLLNLLSNAVKYNRPGGAVTLSYPERPSARLRINVTDTGPGIAPEKMERLFTPFDRLDADQQGVEGSGLGLALSRRLAEAMGGTLGVEVAVGRGSTFWVEFPLVEDWAEQVEGPEGAAAAITRDGSRRARMVLYVEDNLSNVKLIEHLLAHRPEVRLLPAMQGRLGLDLAREHTPELILLDLHLPDMSGEEFVLRLRAAPETREIPVVVISADATPGQTDRLLASGIRGYLTKPLQVKMFLELLEQVLQERDRDFARGNA